MQLTRGLQVAKSCHIPSSSAEGRQKAPTTMNTQVQLAKRRPTFSTFWKLPFVTTTDSNVALNKHEAKRGSPHSSPTAATPVNSLTTAKTATEAIKVAMPQARPR